MFRRTGREMKRCWFDRHRADRVVGAVVAARLVDRQKLHQLESTFGRPINELTQNRDVADSEIALAAQSEQRRENPRDLFLRRKIHLRPQITQISQIKFGPPAVSICVNLRNLWIISQPFCTCQSSTSLFGISFKNRDGRWKTSP